MNLNTLYRTAALAAAGGIMVAAVSAAPAAASITFDFTKFDSPQAGDAGNVRVPPMEHLATAAPFEFVDVNNADQLAEIVARHKVDTVYHLAALLSATSEAKPQVAWELNMGSVFKVLEVARKHGCAVFVPSSIGAFGENTPKDHTPQDTLQRPSTMYGVTKVAVSAYTAVSDGHNGFTLYDSYLGSYINGLGVTGTYPGIGDTSHTVDSQRGIDFLVFQFSRDVTVDLAKFTVLSVGGVGDSDATIGFGNTDVPYLTSLDLDTWSQVNALFTPFADNYGDQSDAVRDINPGDASGNLLFIGAGLFSELNKIDNFKIATLTAAPAVPEPASWALMIGGFALAGAAMRRRSARVVFA